MADTHTWRGGCNYSVAQVDNATPGGTIEIGDEFRMILTDKDGYMGPQDAEYTIQFDATATTVQDVVEGLKAAADALAADLDNFWSYVTVSEDDTKCIITADSEGVPFYLTVETTEAGGGAADDQTFVRSASTANKGPNDINTAENWDSQAVPVSTDSIIVPDSDYSILYGLDFQSILLAAFTVEVRKKTAFIIGQKNSFFKIDADTVKYHSVGRSWLDIDNMAADMEITACGKSGTDGQFGLNLIGVNAGMDIQAKLGSGQSLGLAAQAGESCTFVELKVVGGIVYVGSDTGLTHIEASGGAAVYSKEDLDTLLTVWNAAVHVLEGTPAEVIGRESAVIYIYATGTHSQFHLYERAKLDFTKDKRAKTVTNCDIYSEQVQVKDPDGVVTWTNGWDFNGCKKKGATLDMPANMNWPAPSAL